MNVSFEESLKFVHKGFEEYIALDMETEDKPIWPYILAFLIELVFYGLIVIIDSHLIYIFWILLCMYLGVWLYTTYKNNKSNKLYFRSLNINNLLIWFFIEFNLVVSISKLKRTNAFVITLLNILIISISYFIIRCKKRALEQEILMVGNATNSMNDRIHKALNYILKNFMILMSVYYIVKIVFSWLPRMFNTYTYFDKDIAFLINHFITDVIMVVVEVYVIFPFLLCGYYHNKYAEEYRTKEGKSQIEWYGQKYFNQHIKGTNKEEKIHD